MTKTRAAGCAKRALNVLLDNGGPFGPKCAVLIVGGSHDLFADELRAIGGGRLETHARTRFREKLWRRATGARIPG
jgi:hypothetical protein